MEIFSTSVSLHSLKLESLVLTVIFWLTDYAKMVKITVVSDRLAVSFITECQKSNVLQLCLHPYDML
jgi:hypothetical protein